MFTHYKHVLPTVHKWRTPLFCGVLVRNSDVVLLDVKVLGNLVLGKRNNNVFFKFTKHTTYKTKL